MPESVLPALFGVLVRLELSTKPLDDALPAIALGDGDDVGHGAFFEGIGETVFFTEFDFEL